MCVNSACCFSIVLLFYSKNCGTSGGGGSDTDSATGDCGGASLSLLVCMQLEASI